MPWSGSSPSQTFSRTDGTRAGSTTWQEADAAGVDIVSSDHDTHDQDMANGINACLKKDGGNAATSNLPMGGFRHTNVGAATARSNYARFSDLQDGKGIYVPTVGGTANAITLTTGYSVTAYAAGQTFRFIAQATNSGAATVAVDGLGAKSITGPGGAALSGGQILVNALVTITYDGTQFQLSTEAPAAIGVGSIMAWPTATIPAGCLECDGSAVSRSTYAALFAVIGTNYGTGDGSTTFNVPDYRGYFLRGHDGGEGNDPDAASRTDRGDGTTGDNVGTKQADEVKGHTHGAGSYQADTSGAHNHSFTHEDRNVSSGSSGGPRVEFIDDTAYSETDNTTTNGAHTHTISGLSGSTGGDETRPKNIYVKWIIIASVSGTIVASNLSGPTSSTDKAIPRFNGTSGNTVQDSGVTIDDNNVVSLAGVIGSRQALNGAGAVDLTTLTTKWTTTGANAGTLADGSEGQIKFIVMIADGGDGTLTPTNFGNGSTITFADAGDSVMLQFLDGEWWIISNNGCVVA